jgi:hypothetical protein
MQDENKTPEAQPIIDQNIAPIYMPLEPDWADIKTMHEPLMARGYFSNSWVMYDQEELPPLVGRPTAMQGAEDDQKPLPRAHP